VPSPPQLAHTSSHVLASRCGWLAADELAESTVIVAAAETEMDNGDRTCTRLGCCVAGGSPAPGHAAGEARFVIPRPQQPDPCCAQRSTICGTAQASVRACVVSAAPCPCDRGTAYSKCSVVVARLLRGSDPSPASPTHASSHALALLIAHQEYSSRMPHDWLPLSTVIMLHHFHHPTARAASLGLIAFSSVRPHP
jgi:hypothetical protein